MTNVATPPKTGLTPPLVCDDMDLDKIIAKAGCMSKRFYIDRNVNYPNDRLFLYDTCTEANDVNMPHYLVAAFINPQYTLHFMESLEQFYY